MSESTDAASTDARGHRVRGHRARRHRVRGPAQAGGARRRGGGGAQGVRRRAGPRRARRGQARAPRRPRAGPAGAARAGVAARPGAGRGGPAGERGAHAGAGGVRRPPRRARGRAGRAGARRGGRRRHPAVRPHPARRPAPDHRRSASGSRTCSSAMGYEVAEGPEVESEWFNFDALNFPQGPPGPRPCRTPSTSVDDGRRSPGSCCARTPHRCRSARMLERPPPIYVVCPGRTFRTDELDATHTPVFHQVEGLAVDKGITMAHLKGTLDALRPRHVRRRVAHPAAAARTSRSPSRRPRSTCGSRSKKGGAGWVEWGGCGMVNPNVLRACGIDPDGVLRLRVRHGHRADPAVPQRDPRHARHGRGRRAVQPRVRHREVLKIVRVPLSLAAPSTSTLPAGPTPTAVGEALRPASASRSRTSHRGARAHAARWWSAGSRDRGADRAQEADPVLPGRRRPDNGGRRAARRSSAAPRNFAGGDLVVVALPGAVLPGGFAIAARKTYGHVSDGMICLGARAGHRQRPRRHPRARRRARPRPASDARPLLGPGRPGDRAGHHPGPRLLLLGARPRPRARAARSTADFVDPAARVEVPPARGGRRGRSTLADPAAAPVRRPPGRRRRPDRAEPRGGCSGGCSPPGSARSR